MALNVRRTLLEHLKARKLADSAIKIQNQYRDLLKEYLIAHGEVEDPETGHRWLRFEDDEEPFLDPDGEVVKAIKAERRCLQFFDEDAAWELVNNLPKELREQVVHVETVESIDEDALLGLAFEGKIPDASVQALYQPGKETWAFKVVR